MKKFEGILICTDLDGTLLRNDKTVSSENIEAIEYFKKEGGYFTFITGRVPYISMDICKTINPNAPFGCINGGGLYDHENGKYIYMKSLPLSVHKITESVEKELPSVGFQYDMADRIYFCRNNRAMEIFRERTGVPNIVKDYHTITEQIGKIIFGTTEEKVMNNLIELIQNHPETSRVDCVRAEKNLYDIIPKGTGKGFAMVALSRHLKVSRTVAIGDYDNDIDMLKSAKVGIAVANATENVKAVADYITVSNQEHAIARIISDIEEGLIKV